MEIWKQHPKWDILVSSLGRVMRNNKIKKLSKKVYTGRIKPLAYHVVSVGGRGFPILRVSRLVLETFIGACPLDLECRHLDGDSLNDRLKNLKWGTRQEQIADQKRHGTFSPPPHYKGAKNPAYKFSALDFKKAAVLHRTHPLWIVSKITGISMTHLKRRLRAIEVCHG